MTALLLAAVLLWLVILVWRWATREEPGPDPIPPIDRDHAWWDAL